MSKQLCPLTFYDKNGRLIAISLTNIGPGRFEVVFRDLVTPVFIEDQRGNIVRLDDGENHNPIPPFSIMFAESDKP